MHHLCTPPLPSLSSVTDRGNQVQIKWRISDEDRFKHVRRGVPRVHFYHSVQTCPSLKTGEYMYVYMCMYTLDLFHVCTSSNTGTPQEFKPKPKVDKDI